MPSAGITMMYTSGWPKIQNRCCQSSTLPPSTGSKKWVPKRRSRNSIALSRFSAGNAKITMNEVATIAQTNSGTRLSDIPGARSLSAVTMKLIDAGGRGDAQEQQAQRVDVDVRRPGSYGWLVSGT